MSYNIGIYFMPVKSESDAYKKAMYYKDIVNYADNTKRIIDNTYDVFVPSKRYNLNTYAMFSVGSLIDEYWVKDLFTLRFIYWKKYKLLGLIGYSWPQAEYFPGHIIFQNSSDQDYEEKMWQEICPFFDAVVQRNAGLTADELLSLPRWKGYNKEEMDENLAYYIRSNIYDEIYEELDMDNIIYGNKSKNFTRFSICAIETLEQSEDIKRYLRSKVKAIDEKWGQKEIIFPVIDEGDSKSVDLYTYYYKGVRDEPVYESLAAEFSEAADKAVSEFIATDYGKIISKKLNSTSKKDILGVTPKHILLKYGIEKYKNS